ncbi:MAG: acyltransferase [Spirochaetes bacterium]|jgi:fucose 4-O-acetylase-like acetyltransferase|nr:acyltransferase [Spirochaetota bacterium]
MNDREKWIDYLRLVALYLVAFYHSTAFFGTPILTEIKTVINVINVPVFFLISGYLFDPERNRDIKTFIIKRFKLLMVPYFAFSFVLFFFWIYVSSQQTGIVLTTRIYVKAVLDVLNGIPFTMARPLWFLPCLFFIEIIFYLVTRYTRKTNIIIVFLCVSTAIGFAMNHFNISQLPYSFNAVFSMMVIYGGGYLLKDKISEKVSGFGFKKAWILLPFIAVWLFTSIFNGEVDILGQRYNYMSLFYISFAAGSVFLIGFSTLIRKNFIMNFLSTNTVILLALHRPMSIVLIMVLTVIGIQIPMVNTVPEYLFVLWQAFYVMLQFFSIIPLILIINRFFPFMLGRWYKKKTVAERTPDIEEEKK